MAEEQVEGLREELASSARKLRRLSEELTEASARGIKEVTLSRGRPRNGERERLHQMREEGEAVCIARAWHFRTRDAVIEEQSHAEQH